QTFGAEGLLDKMAGAPSPHPNRVAEQVETAILDHSLAHPCHGALRVANELALAGIQVSSTGVRGVWSRHGLLSRHDRLLRLEKASAERSFTLSEEQIEALERFSPEFRERHIEAHTPAICWLSTPSSSATSRESARSTCRARSTAARVTAGAASTPTRC